MNAINVIAPYKHHGMWVFDDARVGLAQEPFVAGADTMIDRVVADIADAERGFTLIFSGTPFPAISTDWIGFGSMMTVEIGAASDEFGMEGWLCPALFKYFEEAPKRIYVQVKAKGV